MNFHHALQTIIPERSSVRSYKGTAIDSQSIAELNDLLKTLSDSIMNFTLVDLSNKNDLRFGTYGIIRGAKFYLVGTIKESHLADQDTIITFGYRFEAIVLKAQDLGLGTCWMAATFNRDTIIKELNLRPTELIAIVSPIGYQAEKKSMVEKIMSTAIKSSSRKEWGTLFFDQDFDTPLKNVDVGYEKVLEMTRLAPSYKNIQPWRIVKNGDFYDFYTATMEYSKRDIIPFPINDLGIAKCHFDLTAKELDLFGEWTKNPNHTTKEGMQYLFSWKAI